jgi:CMP/dCMP kinase
MIITISRQYGAGGSEVARRVAEALGWRVVDNEMIDRVASRTGLPPEEVAEKEERAPSFLERLSRALSRSSPELFSTAEEKVPEPEEAALVRVTETVVAEIAAEGRVVLVGRAGPAVLRGKYDVLHARLVAPLEFRIRRLVAEGLAARPPVDLTPKDAEAAMLDADANRARYLKQYYGLDWNEATNYHMVLNTGAIGVDGATDLIVARARAMWGAEIASPLRGAR